MIGVVVDMNVGIKVDIINYILGVLYLCYI